METTEQQLNHGQDNLGEIVNQNLELANRIEDAVLAVNFGDNRRIVPVANVETMTQLYEAGIGLDSRVTAEAKLGIASVFDRIAFDSENVRSQSFAIFEGENPIGSMSVLTTPKSWIAKQRYFQKGVDGVKVLDAHAISGPELPEFYIIPGWTKVTDSHRGLLAHPGFTAFRNVIEILEDSAPDDTWMEAVAQGQLPSDMRRKAFELSDNEVGTVIPFDEFPFDADMIGVSSGGSTSTVKMARLLGLAKLDNLGSVSTLGPVFAKKIK
jgi:hypothetical protein